MKYIFFGTPELSVIVLQQLKAAGLIPAAVVTQADKPSGRGQKLTPSPVKVWAEAEGVTVLSPLKATDPDFLNELRALKADTFVVAAYGKMLRPALLEIPKKQTINLHPSLLPLYRGPSPVQGPLLDGMTETGVSIMLIDEEMDHGATLAQKVVPITPDDNSITLTQKVATIGGALLADILPKYINGETTATEQDHDKATFTKLLKKEDGQINWDSDAKAIVNQIRAYQLWPTAWTTLQTKKEDLRVKILSAHIRTAALSGDPGTIVYKNDELLVVALHGSIVIDRLQISGKKPMSGKEFSDFVTTHQVCRFL